MNFSTKPKQKKMCFNYFNFFFFFFFRGGGVNANTCIFSGPPIYTFAVLVKIIYVINVK